MPVMEILKKEFGTEIAQIVEGVTKITELFKKCRRKTSRKL